MNTLQLPSVLLFVILILTAGLSGCLSSDDEESNAYEFFEEEYEVTGDTILSVTNVNGDVSITTWDGDTVNLSARKKIDEKHEERLAAVEINVTLVNHRLLIEAIQKDQESLLPELDMTIYVPRNLSVDRVKTVNGGVDIEKVSGYVNVSVENGRIWIRGAEGVRNVVSTYGTIDVDIQNFKEDISIQSVNSEVVVYINPALNADLNMITQNGKVVIQDLELDLTKDKEEWKMGSLGEGGNLISIKTVNDDVIVRGKDY